MTIELNGTKSAKLVYEEIQRQLKSLSFKPCLAVVLVGEDPASQVYVGKKIKKCEDLGFTSRKVSLPTSTEEETLIAEIAKLNLDPNIDGILVQLPLPTSMDSHRVIEAIDPLKDVDALGSKQVGLLVQGRHSIAPCTPSGIMALLSDNDINLMGKNAVVIGRSQIVGLPMLQLLQQAGATVSLCHSKTKNLKEICQRAEIVVVAAGKPEFFDKDYFNKDAVVIDVGIHRKKDNKLCGDVKADSVRGDVYALSPVPGGVGPMTIAMLMRNTILLAKKRRGSCS